MSNPILVTGSAGFIGFHLCQRLLSDGFKVIGLDAMTDYYDVSLKEKRLSLLKAHDAFTPVIARLEAPDVLENLFAAHKPAMVVHLAAQAGVRYSIDAPRSYVESNINGTFELLEAARNHTPEHLLIASTSSVYGANTDMPDREVAEVLASYNMMAMGVCGSAQRLLGAITVDDVLDRTLPADWRQRRRQVDPK